VVRLKRWKAHQELINQVTFVPELGVIGTCSFDKNVYFWDKITLKNVGSLLLGNGANQKDKTEAQKKKMAKIWQIRTDKMPRLLKDRKEAELMLDKARKINYDTMFQKGKKQLEPDEPESNRGQIEQKKAPKKIGQKKDAQENEDREIYDDMSEGKRDQQILEENMDWDNLKKTATKTVK